MSGLSHVITQFVSSKTAQPASQSVSHIHVDKSNAKSNVQVQRRCHTEVSVSNIVYSNLTIYYLFYLFTRLCIALTD